MDFTEGQRKLLPWWGNIVNAVQQRVSTADLWGIVRDAAQRDGVELRGVSALDMGRLRAIAADQRTKASNLMAASADQAIGSHMIASDLSARPAAQQLLAPSWIVRFEHDILVEGAEQTVWRSSVFEGSLPATIGDLADVLEGDAEAMADDYEVSHLGIGRFQIAAV